MSQPCSVDECKRASRAVCHCCQQNVCIPHLNEHNDVLNSELNPLVDEINILGDRLKTFNIEKHTYNCRQKLEQWRIDCHEKIELVFAEKCQELDRFVAEKLEQQEQEMVRLKLRLTELIREQEATRQDIISLTANIHHLQNEIDKIDQTFIHMNIDPLVINENSIRINERSSNEFDLSTVSPACKTIVRSNGSNRAITSSDKYLLFHDVPNLCLVDRNFKLVKNALWVHGKILDMCWSSATNQFIVIELNDIYFVDEKSMSINRIETSKKMKWASCTCSDTSFFLSTRVHGSSIVEFSLSATPNLIREWKCPDSCALTEDITSAKYYNEKLLLLTRNYTNRTVRMDLKSSITFDCIWSFQLGIICAQEKVIRCCSLMNDEWLIADFENQRLIQIAKDGQIKSMLAYNEIPWFAHLFGPNILAVSVRKFGLNFHRI
ncbi:unnamed protein product [Rotaria socialis]